jgi:hypothetical protein
MEGQDWREQDWVNTTPSLISILNSLTHLEKLHLRRFDSNSLTPQLLRALLGIFKSNPITSLDLELCAFPPSFFTYLSHARPTLKYLTVRELRVSHIQIWPHDMEGEVLEIIRQDVLREPCQLDDLRMQHSPGDEVAQRITGDAGFDLTCLRTLHCENNGINKALLHQLGGRIHHLLLGAPDIYSRTSPSMFCIAPFSFISSTSGPEDVNKCVCGLEENTASLRSLHLSDIDMEYQPLQGPTHIEWLKTLLLSVLDAQHLQKITLETSAPSEKAQWDVLKAVDAVIGGNFLQLTEVEICIKINLMHMGTFNWVDIREAVTDAFPVLTERQLLVVT